MAWAWQRKPHVPTDIQGNMDVRQRGSSLEINLLELSGSTHKPAHPGEPSNRGGGRRIHHDDAHIYDANNPLGRHNTRDRNRNRNRNRTEGIQPCHWHVGGTRDHTNTYTLQDIVRRTIRDLTHWGGKGSNR